MERTARDVRIVLVGDDACGRRGLTLRLNAEPDLAVVGLAADGTEAAAVAGAEAADVILVDVRSRGSEGMALVGWLRHACTRTPLVVLSLFDDAASRTAAVGAGATAFVSKHDPDGVLLDALRAAGRRGHPSGQPDAR